MVLLLLPSVLAWENISASHLVDSSYQSVGSRDGAGVISRDRLQRGRLTRQGTTS